MNKTFSGSPVPRHFVFSLADGTFVVQWDENRVQDLLTGNYRTLKEDEFGHPISDYELNELKSAGRVEHYNRSFVWLYALPEAGRFKLNSVRPRRIRAYYLNTTLHDIHLDTISTLLTSIGLSEEFAAQRRGDLIAVVRANGTPFSQFKDAENAQKQLIARAPKVFSDSAVAFVELSPSELALTTQELKRVIEPSADLSTVIASQTDTSITEDKCTVLLIRNSEECQAFSDLCREMKMETRTAGTASGALQLLEDEHVDLLVMDLQLPDMHGWEMLLKLKEIGSLHDLPVIVLAEGTSSPNEQAFALTVAKVDVYLVKPVSKSRLRQNIWLTLKNRSNT